MILKASGCLTATDFLQFVFYPSPSNQIWALLWNTKHASNPCSLSPVHQMKLSDCISYPVYLPAFSRSFTGSRVTVQLYTPLYTLYTRTAPCTSHCTLVKYSRPGTANFIQYLSSFQDWRICEVEILKIFVKRSSLQFIYVIILKIRCLKDIQDRKEHGQWIIARLSS